MNKWRDLALVTIGCTLGMAYAVACGDGATTPPAGASTTDTDSATGSGSPLAGGGAGRAVLGIHYRIDSDGVQVPCSDYDPGVDNTVVDGSCCPPGFEAVGTSGEPVHPLVICLEV